MKLVFDRHANRWTIGNVELHCGRQVRVYQTDVQGRSFCVWGRFEITGNNNPVFHTVSGRFFPDLQTAEFDAEGQP